MRRLLIILGIGFILYHLKAKKFEAETHLPYRMRDKVLFDPDAYREGEACKYERRNVGTEEKPAWKYKVLCRWKWVVDRWVCQCIEGVEPPEELPLPVERKGIFDPDFYKEDEICRYKDTEQGKVACKWEWIVDRWVCKCPEIEYPNPFG